MTADTSTRRLDLVLFLHGVGARGLDLLDLSDDWKAALPGVAFAAPDAPFPFDGGPFGRQWFSVLGVTPANRGERIAQAASAFDAVVDLEISRAGTVAERTALVGFSQGSIMALDAIGRGRRFAGVLAYSGRLGRPAASGWSPTPVRLVHGEADGVIPPSESIVAEAVLKAGGVAVDLHLRPGLGHGIDPVGIRLGAAFLAGLAAGA